MFYVAEASIRGRILKVRKKSVKRSKACDVAEASIRGRILKVGGRADHPGRHCSGRGIDPWQDSESFELE